MKHTVTRNGLPIALSVVALILVGAALFLFSIANTKRITSLNREYMVSTSAQLAATVDAALDDGYDNVRIIANLLSESLESPEVDMQKVREIMENSIFDFVEFADTEGWDHTVKDTKTYAGDRKYYTEGVLQEKTGMELIYNSRATHETLFMFYSPVYYKGTVAGAIIGVFQAANKISQLLTTSYMGEPADSYLATAEGRIVASNLQLDPAVEFYAHELAGDDGETSEYIIKTIADGRNGSFKHGNNETGASMTRLQESGWYLIQIFPDEVNRKMIANANRVGIYLIAFLMAVFIAFLSFIIVFLREQHQEEMALKRQFDISQHHKDAEHQQQLQQALTLAQSANRAKTTFLNSMSHDIRTPMNAIIGYTNLAKDHLEDKEKVQDYLQKISQSSGHLLSLINDVLDMSRIESGKVEIDEKPESVIELVRTISDIVQADAASKRISLDVKCIGISNENVYCDRMRLNQILLNILSNSIKYTGENGNISFRLTQAESDKPEYGRYIFNVTDNGMGMSREFLDNIYEPFVRASNSTVSGISGTGLGMAITKNLVDMMGGDINIRSELGKGTEVNVTFDLRFSDVAAEASASISSDGFDFSGLKVLLVEDNEINTEIATMILEGNGFTVDTAYDGTVAVEKMRNARKGDYDLILMDIQMPVMDGYTATRQIRAMDTDVADIPIIAMTANAFDEDRRNATEAGMNGHIAKPIDVQNLRDTIATVLVSR